MAVLYCYPILGVEILAKHKPIIEIITYGIHSHWDSASKELPKVTLFTTEITATKGIEFGFITNIKKAKNEVVNYCIYHPGIVNKDGGTLAPFKGEIYVRNNNWDFYLGDTIQLLHPTQGLKSNLGTWRMVLEMHGKVIAQKSFTVSTEPQEPI